jgi:flagellin-like protein
MRLARKGVSPVIATIILVLISVVAGVLLWLWVSGYSSTMPTQQSLYERIKIDAVTIDTTTTPPSVTVYVRNVGNVAVNITHAYILTPNGVTLTVNQLQPQVTIQPGKVELVSISFAGTSGYAYVVKVVTANGVEATYTFVWP